MLLALAVVAFGQHGKTQIGGKTASKSKAKAKPKPKPTPKSNWPTYTPCGVYYRDAKDFVDDLNKGWRLIGETNDDYLWHDSDKEICDADSKVLKAWIKAIHRKEKAAYSLMLYELKCETNQFRLKSSADYDTSGNLLQSEKYDTTWEDAIPDSAGEVILNKVCRVP